MHTSVWQSARKPVWQKFQPAATILTNHKIAHMLKLQGSFVIGWNSWRSTHIQKLAILCLNKSSLADLVRDWQHQPPQPSVECHFISLISADNLSYLQGFNISTTHAYILEIIALDDYCWSKRKWYMVENLCNMERRS